MNAQKIAEFISLSATPPTIYLALVVVFAWGYRAFVALYKLTKSEPLEDSDWFILGVAISFIGQSLDNAYWAIPWQHSFLGDDTTARWMGMGVYFNIFSRQACGMLAAYCHIRSAFGAVGTMKHFKIAVGLSMAYASYLLACL